MSLKRLIFSRKVTSNLSGASGTLFSPTPIYYRNLSVLTVSISSLSYLLSSKNPKPSFHFHRFVHSTMVRQSNADSKLNSCDSEEQDGTMNEFLSRFVWIMRGKLSEVYPDCDKQTIDGMLLIIVGKVVDEMEKGGLQQMVGSTVSNTSQDFSEDLWKMVWEVSVMVSEDMEKARKKEKMKRLLQSEEVKEMCRFAGEAGIRGDLLRELRFKWAREKMEDYEFYENLARLRKEAKAQEEGKSADTTEEDATAQEEAKVVSLPKRHGKIRYKIYGLDLSDPKWAEVADKIHETGKVNWPQEPKPISGKCALIMDKILSLKMEDDPSPLLAEWVDLIQPSKVDWMSLLDKLQEKNIGLFLKVAELILDEKSFETNVRDYSRLIDAHAKENRIEDAERILRKMNENGIFPDIIISAILVHMYSKAGNIDRAIVAFENLRSHGFHPDVNVYNSMIIAYVNAGQPKLGESLMREMEARDIKPSKEIYMALLRSFAQQGDVSGAERISVTMQFAGLQPTLESCTLLVEAYAQAGDPDQARSNFDHMIKLGHKPDDRCTASMLAAYEKKNLLDKALYLLLQLERDGFQPGASTYTVLIDWLGKLQLVDEAEQLLGKIAELGEAPPFKIHVSLCEMYSRAGFEKKARKALGVLEAKKEQLASNEFERIIDGLTAGGFIKDAQRIRGVMESQGFAISDKLKVKLIASESFGRKRPTIG